MPCCKKNPWLSPMTSSWFIASCVEEVRVIAEAVEASDVPVKEVAPISKRKKKSYYGYASYEKEFLKGTNERERKVALAAKTEPDMTPMTQRFLLIRARIGVSLSIHQAILLPSSL